MRVFLPVFIVSAFCVGQSAHAQVLLSGSGPSGSVRVLPTDFAVLEAGEPRNDLPCSVTEIKPVLGFDLRFHSGYEVMVPLRELAGSDNTLTILFRITPVEPAGSPVYLMQRIKVPAIEEDAKGDAAIQGAFDIGEGKFKVEWLMRDRMERVCSSFWQSDAVLPPKDKQIQLALAAGEIRPVDREQFKEEPPVARNTEENPLNVKVLVNFAPQNSSAATLRATDTSALIAILRNIARDPRIAKFSVVAFNLQEQRVLFRQDNAEKIDFPALGEAVDSVQLGTVDLVRLGQKHGDTEFLTGLIRQEVGEIPQTPDAVVFAGPKALLDENVPAESLKQIGELHYPVFYMNYNLSPQAVPWNDAIGKAVKFLKGYEYTITRPRDLWFAVTEMVSRIAKSKQSRRSGTSSSE